MIPAMQTFCRHENPFQSRWLTMEFGDNQATTDIPKEARKAVLLA